MAQNDPNTRVVTAHIPAQLAKQLDDMAEELERSKAWIIKEALTSWIELEEKRHQLTLEAISEIKEGKTVKHKKVESWLNGINKANKP